MSSVSPWHTTLKSVQDHMWTLTENSKAFTAVVMLFIPWAMI